jgi:hypothetical protein
VTPWEAPASLAKGTARGLCNRLARAQASWMALMVTEDPKAGNSSCARRFISARGLYLFGQGLCCFWWDRDLIQGMI